MKSWMYYPVSWKELYNIEARGFTDPIIGFINEEVALGFALKFNDAIWPHLRRECEKIIMLEVTADIIHPMPCKGPPNLAEKWWTSTVESYKIYCWLPQNFWRYPFTRSEIWHCKTQFNIMRENDKKYKG